MRKLTIIIFFITILAQSYGQQMPHYSQYMHNGFVLNPAIAGSDGCLKMGLNVRKQWLGFPTSPFTQSAFIHGGVGRRNGLGLIIFHDVAGAESMLGAELAYAYHAVKNKDAILSLGISVKIMQYVYDQSTFITDIQGDPAVNYAVNQALQPDAAFGVFYRKKAFYWGLGVQQLLSSTVKITSITFLERHYFLNIGYSYAPRRKINLEPSILVKGIENATVSFDLNVKAIYDKKFILGLSYRNHDAIVLLVGLTNRKLMIAYNYDLNTSRLFRYNSGSHEIFLGYKICRGKGLSEPGKRIVPCPAYY